MGIFPPAHREASSLGLTGKTHVWVVTQSVVGSGLDPAPEEFPLGMLGVHFRTDRSSMMRELRPAFSVLRHALRAMERDPDMSRQGGGGGDFFFFLADDNVP